LEENYRAYLSQILDSIGLIEEYTENFSYEEFEKDRKTIAKGTNKIYY